MSGFKLNQVFNLYPGRFEKVLCWDKDIVRAFYGVDDEHDDFCFERFFIHHMCERLNHERIDAFLRGLQVAVYFDRLEVSDKNMVCRFELPPNDVLRKACLVFLLELVEHHTLRPWIEHVVFNQQCFIVMGRSS